MDQSEILDNPVVQRYLHELVGSEGMQVALSPIDGEVTDEEIAEELDVEVNTVRKTLIILNENDLADYRRIREQESGWLTYYWRFQYDNIYDQLEEYMNQLLDMLIKRSEYERENQFYRCSVCQERINFQRSVDTQFTCPHCSGDLVAEESDIIKKLVEKRKEELKEELNRK